MQIKQLRAGRHRSGSGYIDMEMTANLFRKGKSVVLVEFPLGEIENLPAKDNWASLVLSNCAIYLSPSKKAVFRKIFIVLGRGGRIFISDVLQSGQIPEELKAAESRSGGPGFGHVQLLCGGPLLDLSQWQ